MNEFVLKKINYFFILIFILILSNSPVVALSKSETVSVSKHTTHHHQVKKIKSHPSHKIVKKIHHNSHHHIKKTKLTSHKSHSHPHTTSTNTLSTNVSYIETPVQTSESTGFVASMTRRLVNFVHATVANLNYSAYKLGGKLFDTSRGVYVLDCSNYVDHILQQIYPRAYSSLVVTSGSDQPTSLQYYDFFNRLSQRPKHYWNRVTDVEELQPGDILVFRKKQNIHGAAGHVMIVMNKPVRDMNAFMVRVADSAPVGHSQDTRLPHDSGIGIGNLLLKVNPKTGQPLAYAWKVGSHWKENVNFAMGRPTDIHFPQYTR